MKKYIESRFYEFWYDIYDIEKDQFRAFSEFIEYIESNYKYNYKTDINYIYVKNNFMKKFIDHLHESFSSLLLGNYRSFSGSMRMMIESYVCFYLIKTYNNKELWKDWYIYSIKKQLNKFPEKSNKNILKDYLDTCSKKFKRNHEIYDMRNNYCWIKRVIPNLKK